MANKISRIEAREQDPKTRARNFEEVSFGFTPQEAASEASRCLQCKNRPCVASCPVSVRIPEFIAQVRAEDFAGAAATIALDSLFPSICGRVCPQESQCEGSCVLGIKGQPVNIGKLERFVGDWALAAEVSGPAAIPLAPDPAATPPTTGAAEAAPTTTLPARNGHRVAVVGSGPAGLTCAADLARLGYEVSVFEALHRPGGVLVYGIPEFRLPKERIVAREIAKIVALGVHIETDVVIGRTLTVDQLLDDEGFSAVFVGSGAGLPFFMGIPGENLNGVVSANEFLTRANLMGAFEPCSDTPIFVGTRTVVVGGGNVAMDAVRTAKRLGSQASIVYRRSAEELPARAEEIHHAREEGIDFQLLTNPVEVLGDESGWVRAVRCVRMELGAPDASGRRSPVPVPDSEFEIPCECVIMALGTSPNPLIASTTSGLDTNRRGCLVASPEGATSRSGVFAGGDAVTGAATVILAMGAGRRAAQAIHEYVSSHSFSS